MAKRSGSVGKEMGCKNYRTTLRTLFGFHNSFEFSVTVTINFMAR
ncbi:hypothetical protein COLO4_34150 [Corchorus olitorius]|uniref:Uncharacterized protein n=1 Tax=Corchorus olitorius TaxID=93759 RepID=A0A1R3GNH5_9ROSI|nr:hypothetical protein COLO4_34150 [Corchorus olitorius]